jgi:hypothetical protein
VLTRCCLLLVAFAFSLPQFASGFVASRLARRNAA